MKGWLGRAVAATVARGDDPDNEVARWARPLPPTPVVDPDRFQDDDEPFPGHWRAEPEQWPTAEVDPVVRKAVEDGLAGLPPRWADVVRRRDVDGEPAADVAAGAGLSEQQQRDVLNRGRAVLRERIARVLHRGGPT